MTIDTEHFRTLLLDARVARRRRGRLHARRGRAEPRRRGRASERDQPRRPGDRSPGARDRLVARGERRAACSPTSTRRSRGSTRAPTASAMRCGKSIDADAPRGAAVGDAVPRRQAQGRARLSEPVPRLPGATSDALTPFSVAERSLAAGPLQWLGLIAVAVAAILADQLTKHIVASQLSLGEVAARARAVLDPPRAEHRDRIRALRRGDLARRRAHRRRGRLDARLLRALRRPPPGAAGRARARDRRQRLEPRSTGSGSAT